MATPVTYIIFLTNATQVKTLQTQYPTGVQIPPNSAASIYGVPGPAAGTSDLNSTGGIAIFPDDSVGYGIDLSPSYGTQTFSVTYSNQPAPPATFPNPYPVTISCFWVGIFMLIGQPGTSTSPSVAPRYLGARRWCQGFEICGGGPGTGTHNARDASRTPEGMGFAFRSNNNSLASNVTNPTGGTQPTVSWERFYVRLRTLPVGGDDNIWSAKGSVEAGQAALLNVTTAGALTFYSKGNAAYPGELLATTAPLTLNTWYRIDIRISFKVIALSEANVKIYLNGALAISGTSTVGQGLATIQKHASSRIGEDVTATSHGLECDIDDWISADEVTITVNGVPTTYPGMDLTSGSHVELIRPTGFDPTSATSWLGVGTAVTGAYQEVNHNPPADAGTSSGLTNSTVSSLIAVATGYQRVQCGLASASVTAYLSSSPAGTATLAINANARADANAGSSTFLIEPNIYSVGSGALANALPDIGSMVLKYTSPSAAGGSIVTALLAQAEHIGIFGSEDTDPAHASSYLPRVGIHNSAYPNLHVNNSQQGPIAAVRVASGIYTGNNIGQDVFEGIGANWFWVRSLSGSSSGVWYSSMVGTHGWLARKFAPENMVQARIDANSNPLLSIAGSALAANQSAAQYQWIAVSDYAMRFLLQGAFAHNSGIASAVNAFVDAAFTPDAMFFFIGDTSSATAGQYYKGPGHTSDNASRLDTSEGSAATFTAGSVTSKTALHTDVPETAYSAWRKSDGILANQWFDVVSYTGNGAGGNRDIALSLNGRSPLFAIVVPHNGSSFLRDASHTGTNSVQISNGANSTTAIVGGGANKITVSTALNTNLIVYDVFVIAGETTAGWSSNAAFTVAPESQRTGGPWSANPAPVTINPITLTVPPQWQLQRFDFKPRTEERS